MDNDHELEKYSRQIILNEVGPEGQQKLKKASVLIIGIGGLGSSVIQYLNAAGVGKIGIVDYDKVELSNLNRQLIYKNSDIGKSKVDVASNYISELNSSTKIEIFKMRIDEKNLPNIIGDYDILADCTDNLETRLSINDVCTKFKKKSVISAVGGFFGQIASFDSKDDDLNNLNKTYRDLMKHQSFEEDSCDNIGAIGSVVGAIGAMQATEIIKLIIGSKENLINKLLIFDFITFQSKTLKL
ncbi:MAG: HesA/MoeB/ThiF family protein [Pseudomonadota bacterium]|nr:HesA/MoeB/ThiF family protein [Pseudomonadota bacterium]